MKKQFQMIYLVVGFVTILEFMCVRGMFSSFICIGLVAVLGIVNFIFSIKDKNILEALLFILASSALIMAYLPFLA